MEILRATKFCTVVVVVVVAVVVVGGGGGLSMGVGNYMQRLVVEMKFLL